MHRMSLRKLLGRQYSWEEKSHPGGQARRQDVGNHPALPRPNTWASVVDREPSLKLALEAPSGRAIPSQGPAGFLPVRKTVPQAYTSGNKRAGVRATPALRHTNMSLMRGSQAHQECPARPCQKGRGASAVRGGQVQQRLSARLSRGDVQRDIRALPPASLLREAAEAAETA